MKDKLPLKFVQETIKPTDRAFPNLFSYREKTTTTRNPTENTTALPPNHKESSQLIDKNDFLLNSSLDHAESRLFPVGHPDFIPSTSNLVSPFDVASFGKTLLPLINVNIKEKVKDFARNFNSGADYIEDALRESWRESPLNPHNFKHILDAPKLFKHLPQPFHHNSLRKPVVHTPKAPSYKSKVKAPKAIESYETYTMDGNLHEFGINGYKHFEESILRELEKQEELKVEATIHTLFEHNDHVEIIRGKPYNFKVGWKPVAAPTKTYDDLNDIHSQIISPLHTSIFDSSSHLEPQSFHDFDQLNDNHVHSTYADQEELGESKVKESKVKPVRAKITHIRNATPSPVTNKYTPSSATTTTTEKSRYRKRHNDAEIKTALLDSEIPDSATSDSHDAPTIVNKTKRNPSKFHILSLTTSKPFIPSSRVVVAEAPKDGLSTEHVASKITLVNHSEAVSPRHRSTTAGKSFSRPSTTRSATVRTTRVTTTTVKPSRNFPREASKFVDKPKVTGFRGSVKFGQKTTKRSV